MKITIKSFQKKIPVNPKRIKKALLKVFSLERQKKSGEITVCLVTDKGISKLNLKYKRINAPTDVLAFDIAEGPGEVIADIVVSADTAIRNAKTFNTSPSYELNLYIVHGLLHILGYDDKTIKQRKEMNSRAQYILSTLNPSHPSHPSHPFPPTRCDNVTPMVAPRRWEGVGRVGRVGKRR